MVKQDLGHKIIDLFMNEVVFQTKHLNEMKFNLAVMTPRENLDWTEDLVIMMVHEKYSD